MKKERGGPYLAKFGGVLQTCVKFCCHFFFLNNIPNRQERCLLSSRIPWNIISWWIGYTCQNRIFRTRNFLALITQHRMVYFLIIIKKLKLHCWIKINLFKKKKYFWQNLSAKWKPGKSNNKKKIIMKSNLDQLHHQ